MLTLFINAGIVSGKRQAVDSAFVQANASMDSLVEKEKDTLMERQIMNDALLYRKELNDNTEDKPYGPVISMVPKKVAL